MRDFSRATFFNHSTLFCPRVTLCVAVLDSRSSCLCFSPWFFLFKPVSMSLQMPRPRHKNKMVIGLSSHQICLILISESIRKPKMISQTRQRYSSVSCHCMKTRWKILALFWDYFRVSLFSFFLHVALSPVCLFCENLKMSLLSFTEMMFVLINTNISFLFFVI